MKRLTIVLAVLGFAATVCASVFTRQVSVTGTATRLDANTTQEQILVINQGSGSIYVGDSTVTTSTGAEIKPAASIYLQLTQGEKLYGITSGSTIRADVLENGR